jgi:prefoldin beta subunit
MTVQKLQLLQHHLENFVQQKQQIESQLIEVDSALSEIKNTDKAYKIVGGIMILGKQEEIEKDLMEKKDSLALRLKNIIEQENKIKKDFEAEQKKVVHDLK